MSSTKKIVSIQSPTRVDLAGGTLDFWPLFLFLDGAKTINFGIDIFTKAKIERSESSEVTLESKDLGAKVSFASLTELLNDGDPKWSLIRTHLHHWSSQLNKNGVGGGFKLSTESMSPIGGGLGGSSSLSISLLKAFSKYCEVDLKPKQMIDLAGNLEAKVLETPTGSQDYYAPVFGGMNLIEYGNEGAGVELSNDHLEAFKDQFFLVYTGRPHHSGLNNWAVYKAAVEKDQSVLSKLRDLKEIAEDTFEVCKAADWTRLGGLLKKEFEARVRLSDAVTSPEIEKLNEISLKAGAEAVKICGAGGGGCVLVWASPEKIEPVKKVIEENSFQVLNCQPVKTH